MQTPKTTRRTVSHRSADGEGFRPVFCGLCDLCVRLLLHGSGLGQPTTSYPARLCCNLCPYADCVFQRCISGWADYVWAR